MTVIEAFQNERGWEIKILATDLDTEILAQASRGIYPSQQIIPVPMSYITKYFVRRTEGYEAGPQIKNMISFRKLNLMDALFPMKKPFDIIFCRNVMIYFNEQTKAELVKKFHLHLKQDGYMLIGHSESLMHAKHLFTFIKHTIYRKVQHV